MADGQPMVRSIFAYLAVDPTDGTEGIISMPLGNMHFPMVGADLKRMEMLEPYAKRIAVEMNVEVKMVRFLTRDELKVISADAT